MLDRGRIEALSESGADYVVVIPFGRDFASLSPLGFLGAVSRKTFPTVFMLEAISNFRSKAFEDTALLASWETERGVCIYPLDLLINSGTVTSTRLRSLIEEHDMEGAKSLLAETPC